MSDKPKSEPKIQRVLISDIEIGERLRPVTNAGVESLISSIEELGVIKDAIHLRKAGRGENVTIILMAGAHRLEAAKKLGWKDIPARVWADVSDDWALLMEIDDNLAGAELSPLDLAVFLARRKKIYEKLYPETRRGSAGGHGKHGTANEHGSFASSAAKSRGITERQIQKITAVGLALTETDVQHLRFAHKPVLLVDLEALSKVDDAEVRRNAMWVFCNSTTKTLREALTRTIRCEGDPTNSTKAQDKDVTTQLSALWNRAPKAAKRRFISEFTDEIRTFLADETPQGNV